MYTDHDGVEAFCISTDGACSALPEPLPWARGKSTGTDESWCGQFSSIHPFCRVKGQLDDNNFSPYNQGLACCVCVSHSRRPATALTHGRPQSVGELGEDGPKRARDTPVRVFTRSSAALAEPMTPAGVLECLPLPPARLAAAGVCAGSAARPGDRRSRQRTQRWTRHEYPGLDHGALRHTTCHAAILLEERDEFPLSLRIPLDVALRHDEAGMAGEFLHVPETAPDLGDSARRTRNEGAAARV